MGVPGLVPLILNNPSLFTKTNLKDCKLVIDGNCLEKYFYNHTDIDKTHYDLYSTKLEHFFRILQTFYVTPIVVFDGGHEIDDRKLETRLKRARDRIENPLKTTPLLVHETFAYVLENNGIQQITCDFEADHEIVVLANDLGCPLLSFDSDFFVYEVKHGYIPINELNVVSMANGENLPILDVSVYYTRNLIDKFPYLQGKLPLLATVLGNDYVSKDSRAVKVFFKTLKVPRPDRPIFESTNSYFCVGLRKVLGWLERNTASKGFEEFIRHMDSEQSIMAKMSIQMYSNSTEYIRFDLCNFLRGPLRDDTEGQTAEMTPYLKQNHRSGKYPKFVQNVILIRRIVLDCQREDLNKKSAHESSRPLRQALYGILIGDQEPVIEYDRVNKELKENVFKGY